MECKSEMWGTCEHCSLWLLNFTLDKLNAIQIQQLHAFPSVWNDEEKTKCWYNKTMKKKTCCYISHCLQQWQIISQFISRLNPKCKTTEYQCLSTPHLSFKICVYKLLTDSESKNHEVLFWQWFKNTMSGIISSAKLTYSRVTTEQHWKRTESERNKLSKGLVKDKTEKIK